MQIIPLTTGVSKETRVLRTFRTREPFQLACPFRADFFRRWFTTKVLKQLPLNPNQFVNGFKPYALESELSGLWSAMVSGNSLPNPPGGIR